MIDFNKLVDQHLYREFRPKTIGRYYPSEIGNCMRKLWFSYKKPKETEADLVKLFQAGNMVHDFVVDVLKSERTPEVQLLKTEIPFVESLGDLTISGRVDDMLLIRENNKIILVEVKSTRSVKNMEEPVLTHTIQLQVYLHFLKIKEGLILYIERNSLNSKSFEVIYNPEEAQETLKRFESLHNSLQSGLIPQPEAKQKGIEWMCKYCNYVEECENI